MVLGNRAHHFAAGVKQRAVESPASGLVRNRGQSTVSLERRKPTLTPVSLLAFRRMSEARRLELLRLIQSD